MKKVVDKKAGLWQYISVKRKGLDKREKGREEKNMLEMMVILFVAAIVSEILIFVMIQKDHDKIANVMLVICICSYVGMLIDAGIYYLF